MTDLDTVAETIRAHRFRYSTEDELQAQVASLFPGAEREVRLSPRDRIDIRVGDVGIECKVAGSVSDVIRQVHRYSKTPWLSGIVLVTNRVAHRNVPAAVKGLPVVVVFAGLTL